MNATTDYVICTSGVEYSISQGCFATSRHSTKGCFRHFQRHTSHLNPTNDFASTPYCRCLAEVTLLLNPCN